MRELVENLHKKLIEKTGEDPEGLQINISFYTTIPRGIPRGYEEAEHIASILEKEFKEEKFHDQNQGLGWFELSDYENFSITVFYTDRTGGIK